METKQKTKERFFKGDTPHGLVKRTMYKKYLQAYVKKTQAEKFQFDTIIIDGFAGCGRYSNDWPMEIEKYGSPLIAVMVTLDHQFKRDSDYGPIFGWESVRLDPAEELAQLEMFRSEGDPRTSVAKVSMYFVEKKKKNYKILVRNLQLLLAKFLQSQFPEIRYKFYQNKDKKTTDISVDDEPFSFCIKVFNMAFTSFDAPRELHRKFTRSLTFLDPFGFSHTPMEHVKTFAPGEGNEIFITLMSQSVNRLKTVNPGQVLELYGVDEKKVEDENFLEFVKYVILGSEGAELPSSNNIKRCTYTYEKYLKKKTDSFFLQTFEVRNKNNVILYHLIHVTNHIKGVKAMKEAMNTCSQEDGELAMSDYSILRLGQKLNFRNSNDPEEVANAIYEQFEGHKRILLEPSPEVCNERWRRARYNEPIIPKYESISEFVTLGTKFVLRKDPLKILVNQNKIEDVVDQKGKAPRKKGTFPDKDCKTGHPNQWYISFAKKSDEYVQAIAEKPAVSGKPNKQRVDNDQLDSMAHDTSKKQKEVAHAVFEKFQGRTGIALKPDIKDSKKKGREARSDEQNHTEYKTVYEYITHGTPFSFSKKPLIFLWKEQKITNVVNQDGDPPKRKYTFPDQENWYISFAEKGDKSVQSIAENEKLEHRSRSDSSQSSGSSTTEAAPNSSKSARKRASEEETAEKVDKKKRKQMKMESAEKGQSEAKNE